MNYLEIISKKPTNEKQLMCLYCGANTTSFGGITFCSNCELIVKNNRGELISLNEKVVTSLDSINRLCKSERFSEADEVYNNIIKTADDPLYMYTYGIFLIIYSNFNLSKISYHKKGFMEDNIKYREDSWKIYGNARMFLYRCINRIEKNHELDSLQKRFVVFLSMIKLGEIRPAEIELKKIKELGNDNVYKYAKIVFDSYIKKYERVIANSEIFLLEKYYPQNIIYYLTFALFKIGKVKKSIQISRFMNKLLPNSRYYDLILDIEKATAID